MKKYSITNVAVFQCATICILSLVSTISSIITTCAHQSTSQCVTNSISSIVFYMLIVLYFIIILFFSYSVKETRSLKNTKLLIVLEGLVFIVAIFNIHLDIRQFSGILSFATSAVDLILSVYVIYIAYNLKKAKGGRLRARNRPRNRTRSINS